MIIAAVFKDENSPCTPQCQSFLVYLGKILPNTLFLVFLFVGNVVLCVSFLSKFALTRRAPRQQSMLELENVNFISIPLPLPPVHATNAVMHIA